MIDRWRILVDDGIKQKITFQFCPSQLLDSLQEFPCESKLNPENDPDMRVYIEKNLGGLTLDEVIFLYSIFLRSLQWNISDLVDLLT